MNCFKCSRPGLAAMLVALAASAAPLSTEAKTYQYMSAHSVNDSFVKTLQSLVDGYKRDHPDFDLVIETAADRDAFNSKLRILASSDQIPDWFDADPEPFFRQIVEQGKVIDVAKLYEDLGISDRFYPISLSYPKWDDGALSLITWQANAEYFWYNKDLFAKAGVEPPKTIDDLLAVLAKLKEAGITPISIDGKDYWPAMRYLAIPPFRAEGNAFIDKLKAGEAKMSDPTGIAVAKFLQTLGEKYFQQGFSSTDYTAALDLFTSGQAAVYYMGTWELPSFLGENGDLKPNIGYFTMPIGSDKDASPPMDWFAVSGIGTAVLKTADTPEMRDFLKYLFANYADKALYEGHYLPSIVPTFKPDLPPIYKRILDDIAGVKTFAKVWDVQLDPSTVDTMGREDTNLALGQTTPEDYAAAIDQSIQTYLQNK